MKIPILDDYDDVEVWNDHLQDDDALAERLRETEALALIRERTEIRAPLLGRLPKLRVISQLFVVGRSMRRSAEMRACTRMQAWRLRPLWCSARIAEVGDPYAMRPGKA